MIGATLYPAPIGAFLFQKVSRAMDVILHVGAHRTATTSFQRYLERHKPVLRSHKIAHWGPMQTRSGLFSGLLKKPSNVGADTARRAQRSSGAIKMEIANLRRAGFGHLVVSEETMLGSMRQNLAAAALYPDALPRLLRLRAPFVANLTRIVVTIRNYGGYWSSALAYSIRGGARVPDAPTLDRLVTQPRRWRDVLHDVRIAYPKADIVVCPFESFAGHSDALLRSAVGGHVIGADFARDDKWHNHSPTCDELRQVLQQRGDDPAAITKYHGRWQPFGDTHRAVFDAQYAQDIAWLRSGGDGIVRYLETPFDKTRAEHPYPTLEDIDAGNMPSMASSAGGLIYGKQRYLV